MLKYKEELARKLIHLSSIWIPLLYLHSTTALVLRILLPLTIIAIIIDLSRRYIPKLNKLVNHIVGKLMRDHEKKTFSGATYLYISSTLTIAFFSKEIAIFALTILIISDAFAAAIGHRFGQIRIFNKSLEGSLSFAVSAFAIYYFFSYYYNFDLPLKQSLLAIFAATMAELFAKKIHLDDNFSIPLAASLILVL
jgi:dolichol kinase